MEPSRGLCSLCLSYIVANYARTACLPTLRPILASSDHSRRRLPGSIDPIARFLLSPSDSYISKKCGVQWLCLSMHISAVLHRSQGYSATCLILEYNGANYATPVTFTYSVTKSRFMWAQREYLADTISSCEPCVVQENSPNFTKECCKVALPQSIFSYGVAPFTRAHRNVVNVLIYRRYIITPIYLLLPTMRLTLICVLLRPTI